MVWAGGLSPGGLFSGPPMGRAPVFPLLPPLAWVWAEQEGGFSAGRVGEGPLCPETRS